MISGKRNFHPRFKSWSILSLGKVHLVVIAMNKNKYVLANVIKILIIVPKTLPALFISKKKGRTMYGRERFQPPKKEPLQIMKKLVNSDTKQHKINQILYLNIRFDNL
uniref:NADH dehydrogenase subunit 4L n=1 Tax=Torilis scabra TaxID=79188 RepID=A0A650DR56_9APIA|nr:NADH dehydrogenase subunit 4L [Torilis scabra]